MGAGSKVAGVGLMVVGVGSMAVMLEISHALHFLHKLVAFDMSCKYN